MVIGFRFCVDTGTCWLPLLEMLGAKGDYAAL